MKEIMQLIRQVRIRWFFFKKKLWCKLILADITLLLVCNHMTRRPCWSQYNRNFARKIEFSSQMRDMLLFLTTNIAAVTSRANQQLTVLFFIQISHLYTCASILLINILLIWRKIYACNTVPRSNVYYIPTGVYDVQLWKTDWTFHVWVFCEEMNCTIRTFTNIK